MYKPAVTSTKESGFYALIVRIDNDGESNVIHGYKGRYFKTKKAALKSTQNYIAKHNLND